MFLWHRLDHTLLIVSENTHTIVKTVKEQLSNLQQQLRHTCEKDMTHELIRIQDYKTHIFNTNISKRDELSETVTNNPESIIG